MREKLTLEDVLNRLRDHALHYSEQQDAYDVLSALKKIDDDKAKYLDPRLRHILKP